MSLYIIKNNGRYVARSGYKSSFTLKLQHAQIFKTLTEAEKHKCGNETITTVETELEENAI